MVGGGGSSAEASTLPGVSGSGIHIICTAVLYDDLLRQVRVWARLGHSPTEIQDELDSRFRRVATVLEAMAVSKKGEGHGRQWRSRVIAHFFDSATD